MRKSKTNYIVKCIKAKSCIKLDYEKFKKRLEENKGGKKWTNNY